MSYDFNDAQSNNFDLIPAGTVAPLILTIRPGKHGDGGWETKSNSSDATYLNCEYAVLDGPFKGRKFWGNMVVSGGKKDEAGNSIAGNITRSNLRGILESARKIKPNDESETAQKGRVVSGYGDFSGMEFVGKIGIEKGNGQYEDKNKLVSAVPVTSAAYAAAGSGSNDVPPAEKQAAVSGDKPSWA